MLVEDEHTEAIIVKRALNDLKVNNALIHLNNGEEALLVFVCKAVDYEKYLEAIRIIHQYWTLSELPDGN